MLYEMLTGKVPFPGPNPFAIMNDRLLNNPDSAAGDRSRDLAGAAGDHLSRAGARAEEPLCDAHEFAWDLEHLDQVGTSERPELHDWKQRKPWLRRVLFYAMLALIPIVIFGLLLWVARH